MPNLNYLDEHGLLVGMTTILSGAIRLSSSVERVFTRSLATLVFILAKVLLRKVQIVDIITPLMELGFALTFRQDIIIYRSGPSLMTFHI